MEMVGGTKIDNYKARIVCTSPEYNSLPPVEIQYLPMDIRHPYRPPFRGRPGEQDYMAQAWKVI